MAFLSVTFDNNKYVRCEEAKAKETVCYRCKGKIINFKYLNESENKILEFGSCDQCGVHMYISAPRKNLHT